MKKYSNAGHGALDLLEEAVHLLRRVPGSILLEYFVGTGPFLLGFLYFWADMSRGAFAHRHVSEAAFGVALLYIWMKCWHSVFCIGIHSHLMEEPAPHFSMRRSLNLIATQTILQPYSLLVLPFSLLILLPFAWTLAFFQNILVFGNGEDLNMGRVIKTSWRGAAMWPAQNHRFLFVFALFTLVVFLDVGVTLLVVPQLINTLFGVETIFTLSDMKILNTTFLSVVGAITFLCVDPLLTIVYVLRCFYGESIKTGADLIAELKSLERAL